MLQALITYKKELLEDPIIRSHLDDLYNKMLEQNLLRIIEPYSRVQVNKQHAPSFSIIII